MIFEKLQMISTVIAASPYKVWWLKFWNSSFHTREVVHFHAKGFIDKDLEAWLNRASFWIGMRDHCP
jgi:hypothetical protein